MANGIEKGRKELVLYHRGSAQSFSKTSSPAERNSQQQLPADGHWDASGGEVSTLYKQGCMKSGRSLWEQQSILLLRSREVDCPLVAQGNSLGICKTGLGPTGT